MCNIVGAIHTSIRHTSFLVLRTRTQLLWRGLLACARHKSRAASRDSSSYTFASSYSAIARAASSSGTPGANRIDFSARRSHSINSCARACYMSPKECSSPRSADGAKQFAVCASVHARRGGVRGNVFKLNFSTSPRLI